MQWLPFAFGWAVVSAAGLLLPVLPGLLWLSASLRLSVSPVLPVSPVWPAGVYWLVAAALLGAARWCRAGTLCGAAFACLLFLGAGAVGGFAAFTSAGQTALAHRWPVAREAELVTFTGCVVGVPQVAPGKIRFELVQLQGVAPVRRVRLAWYRAPALPQGGESWEFSAKLRAPRGLVNPGSGDYALALLQAGVDATGNVRAARRLSAGSCLAGVARWRQRVDDVRALLAQRLVAAAQPTPAVATSLIHTATSSLVHTATPSLVHTATPSLVTPATSSLATTGTGLLLALALGLQDQVPDAQWRAFSLTGISHLVAISGLHVTLFAWLVLVAVRWVKGRGRLAPAAALGMGPAVFAVAAAFGYALLAGGNLPALRTVWMLALGMGVRTLRRHGSFADAWAAALVGALWLDPFAAASLGFWLSFGAVGALIWSTVGLPAVAATVQAGAPGAAVPAAWRGFLFEQGVVTLVLAPLLALSVGLPAWVSFPVNAVAIPVFSVVLVPGVLLATLAVAAAPWWAPLGPAVAGWWVHGVAVALGACVVALEWCASLPGAHWSPGANGWFVAALAVALALAACTPLLPAWWRGTVALGCVALLLWPPARPAVGGFRVNVLDVGQGSAAVVETASHAVVFDPGPAYGPDADAGGRVVAPFLRAKGWHTLAAVVVSHADADHSAGLEQVLRRFPAATVWWGGDGGAAAHGRQPCRAGLQWMLDGVLFRFLHPGSAPERDDNSGSCVLQVSAAGRSALLLADIPQSVEERLVQGGALPADLVLVAHHGSATASSEALRSATRVAGGGYAVVSAGYRNRWSFPKPAVRTGWQQAGRQLRVTADAGAIQYSVAPSGAQRLVSLRRLEPRWWRPVTEPLPAAVPR